MGVGPSREKLLEIIKASSNSSKSQNNYRIDYHLDSEIIGDEVPIDKDSIVSSFYTDIKDVHRFPYSAIGTITFKFQNGETNDFTCFLISESIIVTHLSFLKSSTKKLTEVITTFSDEKINLKTMVKNEKKNLLLFFMDVTKSNQWLGADEYISPDAPKKNNNKKNQMNDKIKVVFAEGKGTKSDLDQSINTAFITERTSNANIIPFLKEIGDNIDNINKFIDDKNILKQIVGGVIYCGYYIVGLIDKNNKPSYFDQETLKFLYEQVNKAELSSKEGIDENKVIELDLSKKNIGPSHIKLLIEYNFNRLRKLNLLKNQIGPQGAFYLGQSKFDSLEVLILNFNEIGDEGMLYLSKGPFLSLKYLYLFHNNISNAGVGSILDSVFIDTLLLLDLSDNPNINSDGIDNIKNKIQNNSRILKELTCLNLSGASINDIALAILGQIQFPKLKKLILQDIDFTKSKLILSFLKGKSYEVRCDIKNL